MKPLPFLSDCDRLLDQGDTLAVRRLLAQAPQTSDKETLLALARLRERIGTDWQVLIIGLATSLTIFTAALLSYV
jgi:hypothetical protein